MSKSRTVCIKIMAIIVFLITFTFFYITTGESAGSYLLKNTPDATEILFQEKLEGNKYIIFFRDEKNDILCAIIEKQIIGYKILRTSGKCNISRPGYICSCYNEDNINVWVAWGLIADKNIIGVKCDEIEMKIVECEQYNYRICFLIGTGKTPINYTEEYEKEYYSSESGTPVHFCYMHWGSALLPRHLERPPVISTVSQIEIDQGLVGDAFGFSQRFEVVDSAAIDVDGDLLPILARIRVLSRI